MHKLFFLTALLFGLGVTVFARTYSTNFLLAENPISEGGNWLNGHTDGKDWGDVSTTPGFTHDHTGPTKYADPVALLTGTWGPNQSVEATVYANNTFNWPEVELRLRTTMHANWCAGYEVLFSVAPNAYGGVVKWRGPLGLVLSDFDFTTGDSAGDFSDSYYPVKTGDVVKATIIGNVIRVYKNGKKIGQVTDNTYTTGNPGMGFDGMANGDYGYTNFTATDETGSTGTTTPQPILSEKSPARAMACHYSATFGHSVELARTQVKNGNADKKVFNFSGREIRPGR
jgi:hypothetical protein